MASWDEHFAEYQRYRTAHGNGRIPVRVAGKLFPLGQWCNQQRCDYRKGRMTPERAARLVDAGLFTPTAEESDPPPPAEPEASTPPDQEIHHEADTQSVKAQTALCQRRDGSRIVTDLSDLQGDRFGTIYADPPWVYKNRGTRGAAQNHYEGLTLDELAALPVGDLAADDAHLHLWITSPLLLDAGQLFKAWGFNYVSHFIWEKTQMGLGNYWRISHEILLTGVRGDARRFRAQNLRSVSKFPRRQHSAKPEEIRHMIERASPGPYLELFGRRTAPGWTVFGNQVAVDLFNAEEADPAPIPATTRHRVSPQTLFDLPPLAADGG